jgi:hypothetical protein
MTPPPFSRTVAIYSQERAGRHAVTDLTLDDLDRVYSQPHPTTKAKSPDPAEPV